MQITVVTSSSNNWEEAAVELNFKLDFIYLWFYPNNLVLHIHKSVFITLGNYRDYPNKYLGIIFDQHLQWDYHIQ